MKLLKGHVCPETAYVQNDYPYGFGKRCKKRYWIEYRNAFGFRLLTQTSKPDKTGEWNRPRVTVYAKYGMALYLDDRGHVHCARLDENGRSDKCMEWYKTYGDGVPT